MTTHPQVPYCPPRPTAEEMRRRGRELHERMTGRRSVRAFSDAAVPREAIEWAIRTAGTAPSGAHQQPWTFVVVDDPAIKRRIREGAEAEEREFYAHRAPPEWLEALAPLGTDWHKPFLETAPFLIVVFRHAYGVGPGGEHRKTYYSTESVGIAVGFLIVALHTMGLCTLTHTPSPMEFLNRILDRPEHERPFVLLPVGFAAADATVPDLVRKSLDEIAVWNDGRA
jgi:iodotyrosine deiodinase